MLLASCSSNAFYLQCTGTEKITVQTRYTPQPDPTLNTKTLIFRVEEAQKTVETMTDAGQFSPVCENCSVDVTPTEISWSRMPNPPTDGLGQFDVLRYTISRGDGAIQGGHATRTIKPDWISTADQFDGTCQRTESPPTTKV